MIHWFRKYPARWAGLGKRTGLCPLCEYGSRMLFRVEQWSPIARKTMETIVVPRLPKAEVVLWITSAFFISAVRSLFNNDFNGHRRCHPDGGSQRSGQSLVLVHPFARRLIQRRIILWHLNVLNDEVDFVFNHCSRGLVN